MKFGRLAVLTALLVFGLTEHAFATIITTPGTFRADFDFSGEGLLPFTRIDANFTVDSLLDPLLTGESFTFSLFDDESALIASNTLSASGQIGAFGRTFFLSAGDLLDGIGFVTVTGNAGSFAIDTASVQGRQSPLPEFATRNVSYSAVPEPSTTLLLGCGLVGLGLRKRRRQGSRAVITVTIAVSVIGASILAGGEAEALSITLNAGDTGSLGTLASDASGGSASEWVGHASLPYSYVSTSTDNAASSTANYNLSDTGFSISLNQARPATTSSLGQAAGDIYFSVDENATYTALGSYLVNDSAGRRVFFQAFLRDMTLSSSVFNHVQESRVTPDESFTLGLSGGDYLNGADGSLSGTLVAGHDYRFFYQAFTHANTAGASSATASGNLFLNIAPIPEPGTGTLLMLGLVGLGCIRRNP